MSRRIRRNLGKHISTFSCRENSFKYPFFGEQVLFVD